MWTNQETHEEDHMVGELHYQAKLYPQIGMVSPVDHCAGSLWAPELVAKLRMERVVTYPIKGDLKYRMYVLGLHSMYVYKCVYCWEPKLALSNYTTSLLSCVGIYKTLLNCQKILILPGTLFTCPHQSLA